MSSSRSPTILIVGGPFLVLLALLVFGYLDVKGDIAALRRSSTPAPDASSSDAGQGSARDGGSLAADSSPLPPPILLEIEPDVSWECAGLLDEEALRAAIGRHGRDVFACHAMHAPNVSGALALEVNIGARGQVRQVRVRGAFSDRTEMLRCVLEAMQSWTMPPALNSDCAIASLPFGLGARPDEPAH